MLLERSGRQPTQVHIIPLLLPLLCTPAPHRTAPARSLATTGGMIATRTAGSGGAAAAAVGSGSGAPAATGLAAGTAGGPGACCSVCGVCDEGSSSKAADKAALLSRWPTAVVPRRCPHSTPQHALPMQAGPATAGAAAAPSTTPRRSGAGLPGLTFHPSAARRHH